MPTRADGLPPERPRFTLRVTLSTEGARMTDRRSIPPLSPFEAEIGFTRALRVGDHILVSGTTAAGGADGSVPSEAGAQADLCFDEIVGHIVALGGRREDVVRVRMFVTDMTDADAVSASFSRAMKPALPTATLVGVSALYRPEWKVEIEAEAWVKAEAARE
ncbi:Rid family hydrolase [Sphingosinicella terrae]|uniref:Rid family hydrolase n=1 Tax=Sphingosinicella terrae TaxID=2172047 RepID=UPI000E0DEE1F|nr:Rid family hydrolase [Sphingosinicella terrae]